MDSPRDKLKRKLFIVAGTIFVIIGSIGIIVPILPTTPFLLLAAFCYVRGSQRLYDRLLYNRFVGSYLRNYLEGRGMVLKMKIWTLCFLWVAIICSAVFASESLIVRIILAAVAIGVTIHILLIKTLKHNHVSSPD